MGGSTCAVALLCLSREVAPTPTAASMTTVNIVVFIHFFFFGGSQQPSLLVDVPALAGVQPQPEVVADDPVRGTNFSMPATGF